MIDNLPTWVNVANLGLWCRVLGVAPAAHRGGSRYDGCAGEYPQFLGWLWLDTFLNISSQCLSSECLSSESVSSECLSNKMHCVCVKWTVSDTCQSELWVAPWDENYYCHIAMWTELWTLRDEEAVINAMNVEIFDWHQILQSSVYAYSRYWDVPERLCLRYYAIHSLTNWLENWVLGSTCQANGFGFLSVGSGTSVNTWMMPLKTLLVFVWCSGNMLRKRTG